MWTRINVLRYIAYCITHLVILSNILTFLNCIHGDHATMNNYEGTGNVHLQFMDELSAPRYIMSIIVSSYQHCHE